MRALVRLSALAGLAAVAAPAVAAPPPMPPPPIAGGPVVNYGLLQGQQAILQSQHDLNASRAISQQNDLSRLDAQMRTEQNLQSLRSFAQPGSAVMAPSAAGDGTAAGAVPPIVNSGGLVSIPDSALAASNARVRAAARDQR
jgi:hypothetical protein